MRKLEVNQMENLEAGGMNQRNCAVVGLTIGFGILGSLFYPVYGIPTVVGAILTGASGDCF